MKDDTTAYFVSYSYIDEKGFGFGNALIVLRKRMRKFQDIKDIERHIEKENGYPAKSVVIINFQETNWEVDANA